MRTPSPQVSIPIGEPTEVMAVLDWQAASTVVALIGVAVTFGLAFAEQRRAIRKSHEDAEAAQAAAARSERAASLTLDAFDRIGSALERIAEKDFGTASPAARTPQVRWKLAHFNGDMYLLTNIGDKAAVNVSVSKDESLHAFTAWPAAQDVDPDAVIQFGALRTMGTRDATITVEWGEDGQRRRWAYPLPPRPPRR